MANRSWGHSVVGLLKALKGTISIPEQLVEAAQLLDAYYISARYPDGWVAGKPADYFNQRKGEEALDAAQELFKFVRDLLP